MSRLARSIGVRAHLPPCVGPCVADRPAGRLGTIRGVLRSASRASRSARTVVRKRSTGVSRTIRLVVRATQPKTLCEHSIATSRCRKTEWLLCGAHSYCVGRTIFPRSQTNVNGCIVALTEHQLHGDE